MATPALSGPLRDRLLDALRVFNRNDAATWQVRFRKGFAYLEVETPDGSISVGRIDYHSATDRWILVPFHFAKERYDPNYYNYAGWDELDGTPQGALRAAGRYYREWRLAEKDRIDPITRSDKNNLTKLIQSMRDGTKQDSGE